MRRQDPVQLRFSARKVHSLTGYSIIIPDIVLSMAAIIAQLTRAARRKRTRRTYGTNKCLYTLEPFDRNGFNPAIHNR